MRPTDWTKPMLPEPETAQPSCAPAVASKNHLTLKWGTLKAWNVEGNEAAIQLMKRYNEIGSSFSAMCQRDTPEQKEIICKLIDLMPGEIYLSWDGKYVSKDEAKKYVLEYPTAAERRLSATK